MAATDRLTLGSARTFRFSTSNPQASLLKSASFSGSVEPACGPSFLHARGRRAVASRAVPRSPERHWPVRPSHGFHQRRSRHCGGTRVLRALAEQCVALLLPKQSAWTQQPFQLYRYRDLDGLEVDIVAEFPDGQLLAIEVKSRRTVTEQSWSALERFRNRYPDRKTTGIVLHGGTQVAHLHGWLHVLPMRSLWDH